MALGLGGISESALSDLAGGIITGAGTAAGSSSASGIATGIQSAIGVSVGAASVGGIGRAGALGTGTSIGVGFAIASNVFANSTASATGAASGTAIGLAGYFTTGTALGVAIVQGVGASTPVKFDWFKTVISQYANSDILLQLIENFDECVDQNANMQAFYDLIWNVDTAVGYGLDVWGRIVGVNRVLSVQTSPYFGMLGPIAASGDPYDVSPFFAGGKLTSNFALTDAAFRQLIFAKALSNISDGSIKSINQILINLFGSANGNAYCTDGLNMTMSYHFNFVLTPVQAAIIGQSGVLPKPVGVLASIVQTP